MPSALVLNKTPKFIHFCRKTYFNFQQGNGRKFTVCQEVRLVFSVFFNTEHTVFLFICKILLGHELRYY
jgi:hypothetical protein